MCCRIKTLTSSFPMRCVIVFTFNKLGHLVILIYFLLNEYDISTISLHIMQCTPCDFTHPHLMQLMFVHYSYESFSKYLKFISSVYLYIYNIAYFTFYTQSLWLILNFPGLLQGKFIIQECFDDMNSVALEKRNDRSQW